MPYMRRAPSTCPCTGVCGRGVYWTNPWSMGVRTQRHYAALSMYLVSQGKAPCNAAAGRCRPLCHSTCASCCLGAKHSCRIGTSSTGCCGWVIDFLALWVLLSCLSWAEDMWRATVSGERPWQVASAGTAAQWRMLLMMQALVKVLSCAVSCCLSPLCVSAVGCMHVCAGRFPCPAPACQPLMPSPLPHCTPLDHPTGRMPSALPWPALP